MREMAVSPNMGWLDRALRGSVGLMLIRQGMRGRNPWMKSSLLLGGVWLAWPALTGTDPMLKAMGASTRPGAENSVWRLMRQAKPGYDTPPLSTESAWPTWQFKTLTFHKTLARSLAVGM